MTFSQGGTTYKGQFKNGLKEGQGLYSWPDGAWYDGQFQSDRENGFGTYHFSNGDEYIGNFFNGRLHGNGTYTWASGGAKYVGEHVMDARTGYGKIIYKDGAEFEGYWRYTPKKFGVFHKFVCTAYSPWVKCVL